MGGILSYVWPSASPSQSHLQPDVFRAALQQFQHPQHQYLPSAVYTERERQIETLVARMNLGLAARDKISEQTIELFPDGEVDTSSSSSDSGDESFLQPAKISADYKFEVFNQEEFEPIRRSVAHRCEDTMPSTSVCGYTTSRELGKVYKRRRVGENKTILTNKFLPNRRKVIKKVDTKLFCVHYLPRQQQLVVASQDEEIRFFSRRTNNKFALQKSLRVPYTGWSILDVVMSPDGTRLCYSTWCDAIYMCLINNVDGLGMVSDEQIEWRSIAVEPDMPDARMAVFSLRFSFDGREVLCGGADDRIHVLDIETEQRVLALRAHEDDVNAVCYSDTNKNLLFSAGDDGLCKVWDRRALSEMDNHPVGVFAGHRDGVTYIDTRGDDRYLLTNSKDQTIKVWDIRKFSSAAAIRNTKQSVSKQQWDYRWQTMPANARVLKPLEGDTSVATLRGHSVLHTLVRARWSPERTGHRYIYTGCARGDVIVFDTLTQTVVNRYQGHSSVVRDCIWSSDTNEIFTSSWDGNLAMWYWDERCDHATCPEGGKQGAEDTSDENYQPLQKDGVKRLKKRRLRDRMARNDDVDFEI